MAIQQEKSTNTNSQVTSAIDQTAKNIEVSKVINEDLMFFDQVNAAGLAPGEYKKLDSEEEKRRWELLFSQPKSDLPSGNTKST